MKKLLAAFVMFGGAIASAETMAANIPFAFHVPGAQLPAGTYTITRAAQPHSDAFYVRGADRKTHVVMAPLRVGIGSVPQPQITFRCGNICEMAEIYSSVHGLRQGIRPSVKYLGGTEISRRTVTVTAANGL